MPVARLSKAVLKARYNELGVLVLKLMQFGQFHPIRRKESIQDINLLVLGSRAQAVYSRCKELLASDVLKDVQSKEHPITEYRVRNTEELVSIFEDQVGTLHELLAYSPNETERKEICNLLISMSEASLALFYNLEKILLIPSSAESVYVEGFIPASSTAAFRDLMSEQLVYVRPLTEKESRDANTPSLIVNARAIAIFQNLTLQKGTPKYDEIDPTPIVAFVFPLFFGIMFGDLGHGFVLLVSGYILFLKTKYRYWGKLLAVLGSSAMVMGFFRGLFFGLEFSSPVYHFIPLTQTLSAGVTLQNISLILEIATVIGTFHLGTAYGMSFINKMKSSEYLEAFLNKLPTLVLYASIIPFGLAVAGTGLEFNILYSSNASTPFFKELLGFNVPVSILARDCLPVIVVSLTLLVVSHPILTSRSHHNSRDMMRSIALGLLEIVSKPFEFFTNVLSYVRLGVLMITTYVLGSLVAGVLAFGIMGILLAAFLNVLVIAMEALIVYIQDMRLQLYEWLSKFYIGTGIPFRPLTSIGEFSSISFQEK